jgi:hypothetical protein
MMNQAFWDSMSGEPENPDGYLAQTNVVSGQTSMDQSGIKRATEAEKISC